MKIRSFTHALSLIADTMLPWELTASGRVRLIIGECEQLCPLCAVAQGARPTEACPSAIFPDRALPWAGYTCAPSLIWRVMNAADCLPPMRAGDRARLLVACGLA